MKTNKLWLGLSAIALLATGCAKDEVSIQKQDGNGGEQSIVVGVKSAASSRAILGVSNATEISNFENNVVDFTAYLFDDQGDFLAQKSTSAGSDQVIFTGYEAGDLLQVVAIANVDGLAPLEAGDTLADAFDAMTIALDSQLTTDFTDLTRGLAMSGMYGANVATGNGSSVWTVVDGSNIIEVPIERVVARVELGQISFGPDVTVADIIRFQIASAGIQKAISHSFIAPGEITTIPTSADVTPDTIKFYGAYMGGDTSAVLSSMAEMGTNPNGLVDLTGLVTGLIQAVIDGLDPITGIIANGVLGQVLDNVGGLLDGTISIVGVSLDTILGFLDVRLGDLEVINFSELLATPQAFWYVLPNNGPAVGDNQTLLTISGEYDDVPYFYPIAINAVDGTATGDTTDGTLIKRNTRYVINVQFNSLIGTNNPDDTSKGTNLIVTVDPIEWEGELNQVAVW